jgi:hypothetical protein
MTLSLSCDCLKRFCPRLLTSDLWFAVRSCWFRLMMQTFPMIIEMRTYKIKRGLRAEFLKIFKSRSLAEHRKIGMKILGPFLSVEDADTFFWIRAFPDLKSRKEMRDEFYEGKLWKEELEHKLMPMIEKYDVVVVKARRGLGAWR